MTSSFFSDLLEACNKEKKRLKLELENATGASDEARFQYHILRENHTELPPDPGPMLNKYLVALFMAVRDARIAEIQELKIQVATLTTQVEEKSAVIERVCQPMERILQENEQLKALSFQTAREKRDCEGRIRELEKQLSTQVETIGVMFHTEAEKRRNGATKRVNELHTDILKVVNAHASNDADLRDALIEHLDQVRLAIHFI